MRKRPAIGCFIPSFIIALTFFTLILVWIIDEIRPLLAESDRRRAIADAEYQLRKLPNEVEVIALVGRGSERGVYGGAAYRLSARTLEALNQDAIGYLRSAKLARGGKEMWGNRAPKYDWKETPLPSSWTGDGAVCGIDFMGDLPEASVKTIMSELREKGSFFAMSTIRNNKLFLIPRLELAIVAYCD